MLATDTGTPSNHVESGERHFIRARQCMPSMKRIRLECALFA